MLSHRIGGSLPRCDQLTQAFAPFQNSPTAYTGNCCFRRALSPGRLPRKARYPPRVPRRCPTAAAAEEPGHRPRILLGCSALWRGSLSFTAPGNDYSQFNSVWARDHSNWEVGWNKIQVIISASGEGNKISIYFNITASGEPKIIYKTNRNN